MKTVLVCALLLGGAFCQRYQQQEVQDDGSYHPELYEDPYLHESSTGGGRQVVSSGAPRARAVSYQNDPRNAAILSEERYLQTDGKFGASYSQEDGVEFKEESDPDGTRRGSYSWVDPSGQRRTVSYTAGKHGFQATGDHLPNGPTGSVLQAQAPYEPLPQYQAPQQSSQPRYEARPAPQSQYRPAPVAQYSPRGRYEVAEEQPVEQYRPAPQPQYRPAPQPQFRPAAPQPQYRPAPQPQYRPQQSSQPRQSVNLEYLAGPAHPDIPSSNAQEYTISSSY